MTVPIRSALAAAAVLGLALIVALLAWRSGADRTFDVRGRVAGLGGDGRTVFVEHEEVPGYMPAMTMPFEARADLPALDVGDAVAFRLVVGPEQAWIEGVERLPDDAVPEHPAEGAAPTPLAGSGAPLLGPGDPVPDVRLTDQDGDAVQLSDYRGRALVLTFVYTRCPVPDYCPLMSRHFQRLQPALRRAYGNRAQLLSVSFDPEYDTPEVLRDYARRYTDELTNWTFATARPAELARLTAPFGVFTEAEGEQIVHNLVTAVVGPDGRVVRLWRGNEWEPDEVTAAVARALDGAPVRPASLAVPAVDAPVHGPVSSPFGWRRHPVSGRARHHDGVDLAVPLGTPVRSVAPGRVRAVGPRPGYGLVVELDHPAAPGRPAVRTVYAHLSAVDEALRPGARIGRGEAVGASGGQPGRDGVSTGPHLHFEVRDVGGQPLDPGRFSRSVPATGAWRARPAGPPPGFRYRTAADERAMPLDARPSNAPRDTVDAWPAADVPERGEAVPALVLPSYAPTERAALAAPREAGPNRVGPTD